MEKYEKAAGQDKQRSLSKARLGWWNRWRLVKVFNKKCLKALKKLRNDGRVVSTRVALVVATKVYKAVDKAKMPGEVWPKARRTGKVWQPNSRWVRSWLSLQGWGPRRATKKRPKTTEEDCSAMQRYVDKLRWRPMRRPEYAEDE